MLKRAYRCCTGFHLLFLIKCWYQGYAIHLPLYSYEWLSEELRRLERFLCLPLKFSRSPFLVPI